MHLPLDLFQPRVHLRIRFQGLLPEKGVRGGQTGTLLRWDGELGNGGGLMGGLGGGFDGWVGWWV